MQERLKEKVLYEKGLSLSLCKRIEVLRAVSCCCSLKKNIVGTHYTFVKWTNEYDRTGNNCHSLGEQY